MKKFVLIICSGLLAGAAMAAPKGAIPKVRSELELRILNKTPTKIFVTGGEIISVPPQILRVTAQSFAYKPGGISGSKFGRTVLKGDAKKNASVTFGDKGKPPKEISAAEIEVETALTEIEITAERHSHLDGEIPYGDLADALKAAPQSPRFLTHYGNSALSTSYTQENIYDRRTKNLYDSYSWVQMGKAGFQHKTENNITEAEIKLRAAQQDPAFKP